LDETPRTSVGTAFDVAKPHIHDLRSGAPPMLANSSWYGQLESIEVHVSAIGSPAATAVTLRACWDAAGDIVCIPDTTATLAIGLTTVALGSAVFKIAAPLRQYLGAAGNGNLYLFIKTDAGTVTWGASQVVWSE
tara:strand:+ start:5814 stop:6218 length:405 start_codon:yes stop_codon:yes gene_type:complete